MWGKRLDADTLTRRPLRGFSVAIPPESFSGKPLNYLPDWLGLWRFLF
jgi:hypothetical protein